MGVALIWQISHTASIASNSVTIANFGTPYYSISLSLNVILTLMIVIRLGLYNKNVRNAMGAPAKARGFYNTAITMLIESCALYAVSYLLFIGPWAIGSPVSNIFFPILAETQVCAVHHLVTLLPNCNHEQVIAPFLIILRVANRRALTSEAIATGNMSSIHFGNRGVESASGDGTLPGGHPASSTDVYGKTPGEPGVGP